MPACHSHPALQLEAIAAGGEGADASSSPAPGYMALIDDLPADEAVGMGRPSQQLEQWRPWPCSGDLADAASGAWTCPPSAPAPQQAGASGWPAVLACFAGEAGRWSGVLVGCCVGDMWV